MSNTVVALPVKPAALRPVKPAAKQAMVLICRRCERRVDKGGAGRKFARCLRKLGKAQFGKKAVRTVFTPCMSLCPRDAIAVAVVRGGNQAAQGGAMYIAQAAQPKKAARELLAALDPDVPLA